METAIFAISAGFLLLAYLTFSQGRKIERLERRVGLKEDAEPPKFY